MSNYHGKRPVRTGRAVVLLGVAAAVIALAAILIPQKDRDEFPQPPDGPPAFSDVPGSADLSSSVPDSVQEPPGHPEAPPYDFSQPAPEREAVDNDYFDDAAFVGDSRTDGFMLYSGIGTGRNLTSNGLSIFKLQEKKALTIDGQSYTLLEALALEEYGKVYLSLGVNELGTYNDRAFYRNYCDAIDHIRLLQPNAVIYIQGLIPLNEEQIVAHNGNKYNLTNEHLRVYNDLMRQAAEEKQVVYLDLYAEFADENGALPEDLSRDGVHLKKEPCQQWLAYLKSHTVDFDALYPDGPPAVELPDPADGTAADGSGQG